MWCAFQVTRRERELLEYLCPTIAHNHHLPAQHTKEQLGMWVNSIPSSPLTHENTLSCNVANLPTNALDSMAAGSQSDMLHWWGQEVTCYTGWGQEVTYYLHSGDLYHHSPVLKGFTGPQSHVTRMGALLSNYYLLSVSVTLLCL